MPFAFDRNPAILCLGLFADLSQVVHGIWITNMSTTCHLKNLQIVHCVFRKLGRRFITRWPINKRTITKKNDAFKCHWQRWTPKLHKNWSNYNLPKVIRRQNLLEIGRQPSPICSQKFVQPSCVKTNSWVPGHHTPQSSKWWWQSTCNRNNPSLKISALNESCTADLLKGNLCKTVFCWGACFKATLAKCEREIE